MAAYRRVDDLRSPAGWLPVHRDQLRAQRSISSMGSLYFSLLWSSYLTRWFTLTLSLKVKVIRSKFTTTGLKTATGATNWLKSETELWKTSYGTVQWKIQAVTTLCHVSSQRFALRRALLIYSWLLVEFFVLKGSVRPQVRALLSSCYTAPLPMRYSW